MRLLNFAIVIEVVAWILLFATYLSPIEFDAWVYVLVLLFFCTAALIASVSIWRTRDAKRKRAH